MRFCHIAPTDYIETAAKFSGCFLTLAHIIEKDPLYAEAFRKATLNAEIEGRSIVHIMDNSAFEYYKEHGPGYVFDPGKLIELGKEVGTEYIVLPDYPGQPSIITKDAAIKYADQFRRAGFGTFFCPQSVVGNLDEYIDCLTWGIANKDIDYIGISILGVPNAFGVEKNNKLQRYLSRFRLMQLLESRGILDMIAVSGKKIHFLGMVDGPNEISLLGDYAQYIDTWDSSAAVWAGLNGVTFDNSPTGLVDGKFELPVDFELPGGRSEHDMIVNMLYINQMIDGTL